MTVSVTKMNALAVVGGSGGVTVSKIVAYVVLAPGTESGGTPPVNRSFTYAQRFSGD